MAALNVTLCETGWAEARRHAGERRRAVGGQLFRVNAVRRRLQIDEGRQIHARLPVRCEAHDFPFVAVGLKAEKLRKCTVKMSHGIRKRNHEHRAEPAVAPVPDCRRLPRAAAVHHHDGGFVKPRVRISADGVRQVVVDKPHFRFCRPELLREFLRSALLMPHAQEVQR